MMHTHPPVHFNIPVTGPSLAVLAALLLWSTGCDLTDFDEQEPVVVEAFVQTEQPLPPVYVRSLQPLGTDTDDGISDAQVDLRVEGTSFSYQPDGEQPGRYIPTNASDPIAVDAPFELTVSHSEGIARGRGRTPPRIHLDSVVTMIPDEPVEAIRVDSLRRDSLDIPATTNFIYPIDVEAYWTAPAPAADSHWVRTALRPEDQPFTPRIVDFFIQPEAVFLESNASGDERLRRWRGVYAIPVEEASDPLPGHRLLVLVVRGNADYASYIAERDDPDRREPPSNVNGGLGIVTGVSVDSLVITVP